MSSGYVTIPPTGRSSVASAMDDNVRPLLDVVHKLRDVGIDKEIDLPQIAVMGDQSSGKSSVLEALSDIPFPRGSGLVTKCATELRMKSTPAGTAWKATIKLSWNQPQPAEAGEASSPDELGEKIKALTEALLRRRGASFEAEHSILIELSSPNHPDLTVIDLPGIVRTTVEDQAESVIEDVSNLIKQYLEQERTIILAVIPCNQDIATIDILNRAQKVDPDGDRTIGVLTKVDLIDKGGEGEIDSILCGVKKPLKLGYIVLRNRSQQQIDNGLSLADAKSAERDWFGQHEHFKNLDPQLSGVDNLSKKLTAVLVQRIQQNVPPMIAEIRRKTDAAKTELTELPVQCQSDMEAKHLCSQLLSGFDQKVQDIINGEPVGGEDLSMCAQLHAAFDKYDAQLRERLLVFLSPEYKATVTQVTAQKRGVALSNFLSPPAFTQLLQGQLSGLQPITKSLVGDCCELLRKAIKSQCDVSFRQHEKLCEAIKLVVDDQLAVYADTVTEAVTKRLAREARPFTVNHYYAQTLNKLRATAQQLKTIQDQPLAHSETDSKNRAESKSKVMAGMMDQLELARPSGAGQSRRGKSFTFYVEGFHASADGATYTGWRKTWKECATGTMKFSNNNDLTLTLVSSASEEEIQKMTILDLLDEDEKKTQKKKKKPLIFHGEMGAEAGLSLTCPKFADMHLACPSFKPDAAGQQDLSISGASNSFKTALRALGIGTQTQNGWRLSLSIGAVERPQFERNVEKFVQEYSNCFSSNDELADLDMQMSLFAYAKVAMKRIADDVPMIIHQDFITDGICDASIGGKNRSIREQLSHQVESGVLLAAVKEGSDLTRKREALEHQIEMLEKGLALLKEKIMST